MAAVDRLIAVAPPLAFFDLAFLASCSKPKLFVAGNRDPYCSVGDLARQLGGVGDPKACQFVPGADHFFCGYEPAISEAISTFVAG